MPVTPKMRNVRRIGDLHDRGEQQQRPPAVALRQRRGPQPSLASLHLILIHNSIEANLFTDTHC
ncbi:polyprotein [Frankliniella fusca]|uniref:Polyprotein n=1 Tax=Frankliniella fusca TaxID=407009 RepID=A0AAE1HGY6_9NEOP|nr:polyprotein [Frankliniella fusca]